MFRFYIFVFLALLVSFSARSGDAQEPAGHWHLALDGARAELVLDFDNQDGWQGHIVEQGAQPDNLSSIDWNPGSNTLTFRRDGINQWQWFQVRIVDAILKGRATSFSSDQIEPQPIAFVHHLTGWNRDAFDQDLAPRVFDAVLNGHYLARIRIDRTDSDPDQFIGQMKVHATMGDGALAEELEFDIDVTNWDGQQLSFQRGNDSFWQSYSGVVDGAQISGTFTQSNTPQVFEWSGHRAEVLTAGLRHYANHPELLPEWQETTRRRLALLMMDGAPDPVSTSIDVLQANLPPLAPSQMSPQRDDNPNTWPQAYALSELEFMHDVPDRHTGGVLQRRAHGYLARPTSAANEKKPAVLVLNGHGGSAWGMMNPNDPNYWYGDSFARRGYIVLALDVSHRTHGDDPAYGNIAHPPIASPGYSSDWEEDGERVWTAMRGVDHLLGLPDVDATRIVVAGLSMGGEVAALLAAMDLRVGTAVVSGYTPDFNVMAWNINHPCWQWDHADITEYVNLSDYLSMIAPRRLIIQSGQSDFTFSLRSPPFSADKQVVRRVLPAYALSGSLIHHLHGGGHNFRVGDLSVAGIAAQGISTTTIQSPPWLGDMVWQIDATTTTVANDLFALLGSSESEIFSNGFESP